MDFLGNGTGCIVWSSPLPTNLENPIRYIDLMGGKKPYIMSVIKIISERKSSVSIKAQHNFISKIRQAEIRGSRNCLFQFSVSKTIARDDNTGFIFTSEYQYHHVIMIIQKGNTVDLEELIKPIQKCSMISSKVVQQIYQ